MKLKRCVVCGSYTLQELHCGKETKWAGYKFVKIKSAQAREFRTRFSAVRKE